MQEEEEKQQATRWEDPQVLACKKKAGRQAYNKYSQAHGVAVVARVCVCVPIYIHTYIHM